MTQLPTAEPKTRQAGRPAPKLLMRWTVDPGTGKPVARWTIDRPETVPDLTLPAAA